MSKLSQVVQVSHYSLTSVFSDSEPVQAKSVLEKSRKDGSIICSLASDCQYAQAPTKSFSASNLFHKTRAPNLILLRQAPVNSNNKIKHFYSFEVDCNCLANSLGSSHQYSRTSFKTSTRLQESVLMTQAQIPPFLCRIIGTECPKT